MDLLTWHKSNPIPCVNGTYLPDTEYLLFFKDPGVPLYGFYETKSKYYVTPANVEDKDKWNHPTIKPLHIIENLIINSSREGDVVLDPFMGSGTTAVAAIRNNRRYIGYEINEKYHRIAEARVAKVRQSVKNTIKTQQLNLGNFGEFA